MYKQRIKKRVISRYVCFPCGRGYARVFSLWEIKVRVVNLNLSRHALFLSEPYAPFKIRRELADHQKIKVYYVNPREGEAMWFDYMGSPMHYPCYYAFTNNKFVELTSDDQNKLLSQVPRMQSGREDFLDRILSKYKSSRNSTVARLGYNFF